MKSCDKFGLSRYRAIIKKLIFFSRTLQGFTLAKQIIETKFGVQEKRKNKYKIIIIYFNSWLENLEFVSNRVVTRSTKI